MWVRQRRAATLNAGVFDGGPGGARRAAPSNPSAGVSRKKVREPQIHVPLYVGLNSNPRQKEMWVRQRRAAAASARQGDPERSEWARRAAPSNLSAGKHQVNQ